MSEFKEIEDLSYTSGGTEQSGYDWICTWFVNGRLCINDMSGHDSVEICTRQAAVALRDWLTQAIGDGK